MATFVAHFTLPIVLHIISSILNFIGALFLAFEILWGYPRGNRRRVVEAQLAQLRQFLAEQETSIRSLPHPYNVQDKDALILKVHAQFDPSVTKLETELNALTEGHEEQAFNFALLGTVLLATGFVLDGIGTFIDALK